MAPPRESYDSRSANVNGKRLRPASLKSSDEIAGWLIVYHNWTGSYTTPWPSTASSTSIL
jgi:hypothetical protein